MRRLARHFFVAVALLAFGATAQAEDITVFAAASLTDAMRNAIQTYEAQPHKLQTGTHIRLSFASSSTLARQIAAGAPADIYVSANQKWMDWLAEQDLIDGETRHDLLTNALVLVAPRDSNIGNLTLDDQTDFTGLIGAKDRIAIGDPDHVPAGIYAKQALIHLGKWDAVEPRLARADNVRAALALVERGEAPLGIVYRTDAAIADGIRIIATFPESSHLPISYPIAMTKGSPNPETVALLTWLLGNDAGRIFAKHGFAKPAETQNR